MSDLPPGTPRADYRADRLRELERRAEYLDGERRRLERLLADALRVAVAGTEVSPLALLEVLGVLHGTNLGRAASVERRERERAEFLVEKTIRVLRESGERYHGGGHGGSSAKELRDFGITKKESHEAQQLAETAARVSC